MPAKIVKFGEDARAKVLRGVNVLADAVTVTLGTPRPQRGAREVVGCTQRHQGRRDGGQGDRAPRQVREHGRPDGEGGRVQDLRRRRRRHHHGDRARPLHLHRGRQDGRRGTRPDELEARHRARRGRRRRGVEAAVEVDQGQGRDRPGRHRLGERRQDHRRHDRRGDGEGRQGGRDHGRGGQGPRDPARRRRGHAVRPRLPLALLRHRPRPHGGRAGGRVHPHPREEDLVDEGSASVARAGGAQQQAAPRHRRGSRGRSAGHTGREQDPRHVLVRGGEGARASAIAARRCWRTSRFSPAAA